MMSVTVESQKGHVAMIAFPFTSHPLIFLHLACKLASAAPEVQFSFFNTTKSNRFIFSTQNMDLPVNFKAYDVEDGVPEGFDHSEFTKNSTLELIFFINALPGNLERGMDEAVKETGRRITCFLTDAYFSFNVSNMAEELNVPWIAFWVPAPYALPAYLQMEIISQLYSKAEAEGDQPGDQLIDLIPGLSPIKISDLPSETFRGLSEPGPSIFLSITQKIQQAFVLALNSYEEINPTLLTNDLKSKFKNLLYVGCLTVSVLPTAGITPSLSDAGADSAGCLSWLDEKKPASVVYVSFGTIVTLSREEVVALAEALEASGIPFLWSLKDILKKHLPDGFLERTNVLGSGKVVPWSPQNKVLAHNSIGVHITHCGYNAVCESILGGVPMICRSGWADNHMNAKMVEEMWGIGVRVEGGAITKSGMLKSLETIFHHDKGKKMREAINSMKEVLIKAAGPNGSAAKDFKTLLQIITSKE